MVTWNHVRRLPRSLRYHLKRLWHFRGRRWPAPKLTRLPRRNCYVAFIDLLSFGSKVAQDVDGALGTYDEIFREIREMSPWWFQSTTIAVVSDSVFLTSMTLPEIVLACRYIQQSAIFNAVLVRGAITHGVHVEARHTQSLFMVSPALVQAVRIAHSIDRPSIVLDSALEVPLSFYPHAGMDPFERWLFFYEGCWVVSPFFPYFSHSTRSRISHMMGADPEHKSKYEWFLGLYKAVTAGEKLLP